MRRLVVTALIALTAFGTAFGAAASLAISGGDFTAGAVEISGCDDHVRVERFVLEGNLLSAVDFAEVDDTCSGQRYRLVVRDAGGDERAAAGVVFVDDGRFSVPTADLDFVAAHVTLLHLAIGDV